MTRYLLMTCERVWKEWKEVAKTALSTILPNTLKIISNVLIIEYKFCCQAFSQTAAFCALLNITPAIFPICPVGQDGHTQYQPGKIVIILFANIRNKKWEGRYITHLDTENLENEDVYLGSWPYNTSGTTFCWINSWKHPTPSQREQPPTYHYVSFKNCNFCKNIDVRKGSFLGGTFYLRISPQREHGVHARLLTAP